MNKWRATLAKAPIRLYRFFISPLTGQNCRFQPTCSAYAEEAIDKHGALKGLMLTGRRLLKCNPWHNGPFEDPVP